MVKFVGKKAHFSNLSQIKAFFLCRCWFIIIYITVYNHGNNIVGRFDVLPNFPFTTSEMKRNYL